MVEYYFDDIEKQKKLKIILDEWLGTPFRHHCGVKGLGCDCIHFCASVFDEMGIFTFKKSMVPDYSRDWHLHNTREALLETVNTYLKTESLKNFNNLMNGDLILSHYGKAASHAGIYYDGYVYQSLNGVGVKKLNFNDRTFKSKIRFVHRIIK